MRFGDGPSVGAPPSDFTGTVPPANWCLEASRHPTGDLGIGGGTWDEASRSWLGQILSDSTDLGDGWRRVLGGAPRLSPKDTIIQITDDSTCHQIAELLNKEFLGWRSGPPPVVIYDVKGFLIAFPSNLHLGEFGLAVGMTRDHELRGASTW